MIRNLILPIIILAGCSAQEFSPSQMSASLGMSTEAALCFAYNSPSTPPLKKLMAEAELAVRNTSQCNGRSYGGSSVAARGMQLYTRTNTSSVARSPSVNNANCSDFGSGAAAQKYFLALGGPLRDPNDLDRDGDGLACEYGSQIRRIAAYRAPAVRATRPRFTNSRCYTGPRGGTYTITSGGNKNYSGC